MSQSKLHPEYLRQKALQEALLARKNHKSDWYNGIYDRWDYPVLTREHIPLEWRFDPYPPPHPFFFGRGGGEAGVNPRALARGGKIYPGGRGGGAAPEAPAPGNGVVVGDTRAA